MNYWSKIKELFHKKPKIIVVLGQTSSGKTDIAINLAHSHNAEIISADSRQVYRGLDLGSGKVTKEEMKGVPHYMLDVADPREVYSVAQFQEAGTKHIKDILDRGKTPIICGGTGQYIDALVHQSSFPAVAPNYEIRRQRELQTTDLLYSELMRRDPARAKNIDQHNKVRLQRALEIVDARGSVPALNTKSRYDVLYIGLKLDQDILYKRILGRITDRLDQGMLQEARSLQQKGLSYERMDQLGLEYRFMAKHLKNELNSDGLISGLNIATRQFAKRQMTWFKRNKDINWFNPIDQRVDIFDTVVNFLKK